MDEPRRVGRSRRLAADHCEHAARFADAKRRGGARPVRARECSRGRSAASFFFLGRRVERARENRRMESSPGTMTKSAPAPPPGRATRSCAPRRARWRGRLRPRRSTRRGVRRVRDWSGDGGGSSMTEVEITEPAVGVRERTRARSRRGRGAMATAAARPTIDSGSTRCRPRGRPRGAHRCGDDGVGSPARTPPSAPACTVATRGTRPSRRRGRRVSRGGRGRRRRLRPSRGREEGQGVRRHQTPRPPSRERRRTRPCR